MVTMIQVITRRLIIRRPWLERCGLMGIGTWMAGIGISIPAIGNIRHIMARGITRDIGLITIKNGVTGSGGSW